MGTGMGMGMGMGTCCRGLPFPGAWCFLQDRWGYKGDSATSPHLLHVSNQ